MCTSGVGPSVQHLGRSTQRSLSRQEHSSSTQLIPHFGARSRVKRSWGISKQRHARSQEKAKPSSFLELQCRAVVWDKHNGERDTNFGCVWTEPQMQSISSLWPRGPHLLQCSPPWRQSTQRQQILSEPDPQGFYSKNWGGDITINRAVTAMEQRGDPFWLLYHHTFYKGDKNQHMLRKEVGGIHTKTALALKTLDSHSLHRDSPTLKHPLKTTVDNCFP